ncbi:hypothetical protein LTR62_005935 [Meristemomyces frigidus]|uniref:Proteasome inhibitor PI31 subunit n=1 Tax=Meristemomyces frigidus TaxID=1508187 RepID=A0AAN7THG6_9PEZI|nr:hypothetical protein LTR62_005935 [Meristemomyces frigidus]
MANSSPENVLSACSLSTLIVASLPAATDAQPQIRTPHEAIALGSHAAMIAVGFRLIGLGEDHKIDVSNETSNSSIPTNRTSPLPAEWNATPGSYAFCYAHGQSSMEYLIKVSSMGRKAVVMGMGMGDDRTSSFDIRVQEYISNGNLPATITKEDRDSGNAQRKVMDVFISHGRLSDFGNLMRLRVIQKVMPSIRKEGYEESQHSSETAASSTRDQAPGRGQREQRPDYDPLREDREPPPARPFPLHDPLLQPRAPSRPMPEPMPGFEDEFETQRGPRGGGMPGAFPRIGERDLYPQGLGPNDPFRGGVGPGFGGMGGGGMHPTFEDPMFAGQGQRGGGYDSRAPPGSRFDPVGPGMGPGMGGGHPRGAGMGGRPPNPFGGFGGGDFI